MPRTLITLTLIGALGLTACANNAKMRGLATQIGSFTNADLAATDNFKTRNDTYNVQLQARLARSDANAAADERLVQQQRQAWIVAGQPERARGLTVLTSVDAATIVTAMNASIQPPAPLDAGNFDAQMAIGQTAAASLAKKPSAIDQLKTLVALYGTVNQTLTQLKTSAAKSAPSAAPANPAPAPAP